ncbi:uncharacterized protein GLRG_11222 [Colletotrichum graminicola M1.001]|uniref:Uncharacterized protein n=1 Tax=Colletotrichum graminicola (strain M1.001 / M2 / FGSC 10212) TaxID=645133 RepID=E3QYZ0_COLGM|nr:uncharacterized protein GLRG_11222 [Colletotrichum graminicola M1.001]EFQ36078.1 hypothetical protein GLRG_11222 [Colletotrichum graminicola M1.001]
MSRLSEDEEQWPQNWVSTERSLRSLLSKQVWKELPERRDCTAPINGNGEAENEKGEKEDGKEEEDDGDGDGDDNDEDEGEEDGERTKLHERRGADQARETEMEANSNSDPQEAHPATVCTAGSNHGGDRCGGIKNAISNHSVWPFHLPFSQAVKAGHQSSREGDTCQGERRHYGQQAYPRGHEPDSQKVEEETGVFSLEEIGECLEHMKRERRKKQREHGMGQCNE